MQPIQVIRSRTSTSAMRLRDNRASGVCSRGQRRGRNTAGRSGAAAGRSGTAAGRNGTGGGKVPTAPRKVPRVTLLGGNPTRRGGVDGKKPLTLWAKPERNATPTSHAWSVGGLFYDPSFSCSDLVRILLVNPKVPKIVPRACRRGRLKHIEYSKLHPRPCHVAIG